MNIFHDDTFTCFHCGESGDVLEFVSKIENIPLEELEQKKLFRFWDKFLLLCEFYRISADGVLKEIQTELSKKYILSLKYSKTEPDTDLLESSLCCKFGIQKEFWNADTDNIMNYLVSRKETL